MHRTPRPPRTAGFTLLEVLVALVVVSLGLSGILYSQARGVQALNANGWRAQAAVLAEHIVDRARANPVESYSADWGGLQDGGSVAASDLATWKAQLARSLPAGDGRVELTAVDDPQSGRVFQRIDVVVRWDDRRAGASDEPGPQLRHLRVQGFRMPPP